MEASRKNHRPFFSMMSNQEGLNVKNVELDSIQTVNIPIHLIEEQLRLYDWRRETNDIVSYQWVKIQPHSLKQVIFVLKPIQKLTTLDQIKVIQGSKIFKNISKIFNAFFKLYQKFGPFQLKQQFIAFDVFSEPFIWMNSDYLKNKYTRDHVSEVQFAQNILSILLKYSHKFENIKIKNQLLALKGKYLSLKQISQKFNNFYQQEIEQKKRRIKIDVDKIESKAILSFNNKSKIKKKYGFVNRFKTMAEDNSSSTSRSDHFSSNNNNVIIYKIENERSFEYRSKQTIHQQFTDCQSKLKKDSQIKIQENELKYENNQTLFIPPQQLQISIQFQDDEIIQNRQVIPLQKLDQIKKTLVTSISFQ